MAVSAHAQQKIGEQYLKSWSTFHNFSSYTKSGMGSSDFTPEVVVWPLRGQIGKKSLSVRNRGRRT